MREFRPANIVGRQAPTTQSMNGNGAFRVSQTSTAPYVPKADRTGRCKAKDDTCKGYAVKGSDFCVGHKRSFDKKVNDAAD